MTKEKIIFADNESVLIWTKDKGITDTEITVRNIFYKDRLLDNKQLWVSGDGERLLVASKIGNNNGRDVRGPLLLINLTIVFLNDLSGISLDLEKFKRSFAEEFYLSAVSWTPQDDVTVTLTSRNQSLVSILLCSSPSFNCAQVH